MPTIPVDGTNLHYLLISHDKDGRERLDDPEGRMSEKAIAAAKDGVTDIFLISHGWKGDVPAAMDQYGRWIKAMADCTADRARIREARPGFKALLLGLHWPSQPWGDEGISAAPSFDADEDNPAPAVSLSSLVDTYADRIADTPRARQALETILASAAQNIAPPQMPPEVEEAYRTLDEEAGLGSEGEGAAPGDDRDPFDPKRAYRAAMRNEREFGSVSLGGLLSPLRQLSFWVMKKRARTFGEGGGHDMLRRLQTAAPNARVHLMGHSFGCVVMSSILGGRDGKAALMRPVDTVFLVQGAVSFWSFCNDIPHKPGTPGYFLSVIKDHKVRGPLLVTLSEFDKAVGIYYPIAAGVAGQVEFDLEDGPKLPKFGGLGTFGMRGPGPEIQDMRMLPADGDYGFEAGKVYNLHSGKFIKKMDGASGAHSDIAHPEVAHAFWEAIIAGASTQAAGR